MMTVADMAIGFAVAWESKLLSFAPSINNNYDFVGAGIAGDWLETKTEVVQTTKRMGFARGVLFGSNGPVMRYNGIVKNPAILTHALIQSHLPSVCKGYSIKVNKLNDCLFCLSARLSVDQQYA